MTTDRIRNLYSWAFAWRTSDDVEHGETDLSAVRDKQRAEFDRWLADRDKEVAARAWDEGYGDDTDVHTPRTNPYRGDNR
jgi:hypothetical protein